MPSPPPPLVGYLQRILNARVYDVAIETPLERAPLLSRRARNHVWLKREDRQPIFSYKIRGAYNKMVGLPREALEAGLVAASAGNHAQGVGMAAQRLGARATVVAPRTTPAIKAEAIRAWGVSLVLAGDTYDEAYEHATSLACKEGWTFIHPYDDPEVIAGQGTIGMEIARQLREPIHTVFVPVGGGGLVAGVGAYLELIRPEIRIVGVEPEDSDSLRRSLEAGRRVALDRVGQLADGVAVRVVGEEPFRIAQVVVDDMVVVSNDEICAAVRHVYEDCRAVLEPAGALSYAGLLAYVESRGIRDQNLVAIASGANVNFDRLGFVAERAAIGARSEGLFAVTIPERRGSFRHFCRCLGSRSLTEFNYRYAGNGEAHVFVGLHLTAEEDSHHVLEVFRAAGYDALDLTDSELAKMHVRHMVGGRCPAAIDERLFRFGFPERPGALLEFLEAMGDRWSISLFHYRNHGADFGRVLVGMDVPPAARDEFQNFVSNVGYEICEETGNPLAELFL